MDDAGKRVYDFATKRFASRWLLSVNINPRGPPRAQPTSISSANSTAFISLKIIPAPDLTGPIG